MLVALLPQYRMPTHSGFFALVSGVLFLGSFGDVPRIFTFSVRSLYFSVESVLHPARTSRYEDNLTNPR
jgi:hypothetical protein